MRWAILVLVAVGVLAALGGFPGPRQASASDPAPGVVETIALEPTQTGARLSIITRGASAPRRFFLNGDAPRFVVDLPEARLSAGGRGAAPAAGGLIRGLRTAQHANGLSRIVVDLSAEARLAGERRQDGADGRVAFIFELAASRPTAPPPSRAVTPSVAVQAIAFSPAEPRAGLSPPPQPRPERAVVVIDAGHGGRDPGAISRNGLQEKDVVLDAALQLRAVLEASGRYHVVLTREADRFVELADRVQFARAQNADLFISLHADAHANTEASGASIYTLSEQGSRRARRIMGAQNWRMDLVEAPQDRMVGDILVDLAQRDTTNRSAAFAAMVIDHLQGATPLLRNTHRNAGFFVLLAPDVPAVLLEMGFLTNPDDERRLADPRMRRAMMVALSRAVDAYFAAPQIVLAAR